MPPLAALLPRSHMLFCLGSCPTACLIGSPSLSGPQSGGVCCSVSKVRSSTLGHGRVWTGLSCATRPDSIRVPLSRTESRTRLCPCRASGSYRSCATLGAAAGTPPLHVRGLLDEFQYVGEAERWDERNRMRKCEMHHFSSRCRLGLGGLSLLFVHFLALQLFSFFFLFLFLFLFLFFSFFFFFHFPVIRHHIVMVVCD